jgi:hypothetical protein
MIDMRPKVSLCQPRARSTPARELGAPVFSAVPSGPLLLFGSKATASQCGRTEFLTGALKPKHLLLGVVLARRIQRVNNFAVGFIWVGFGRWTVFG